MTGGCIGTDPDPHPDFNGLSSSVRVLLGLRSICGSSSDSLVTLLNASIKTQNDHLQSTAIGNNTNMDITQHSDVDEMLQYDLPVKKKKKKRKHGESVHIESVYNQEVEEKKRKKKFVVESENVCYMVGVDEHTETSVVKKKKKKPKKHEDFEISAPDQSDINKKKKHKSTEGELVSISGLNEVEEIEKIKKKKKHKSFYDELDNCIVGMESNNKKKKHKDHEDLDVNLPDYVDVTGNSKKKKKKKHKHLESEDFTESKQNCGGELSELPSNDNMKEAKKKTKKHKILESDDLNVDKIVRNNESIDEFSSKVQSTSFKDNSFDKKNKQHKKDYLINHLNEDVDLNISKTIEEENIGQFDNSTTESNHLIESSKQNKHHHINSVEQAKLYDFVEKALEQLDNSSETIIQSTPEKADKYKEASSNIMPKKHGKRTNNMRKPLKLESHNENLNDSSVIEFINETLDTLSDSQQLSDLDTSTLKSLHIVVPWTLPASHLIETRMSGLPTPAQQKQFKELVNIEMKYGPYTKEEDQKIQENWEQFCKDHDLEQNPALFFPSHVSNRNLCPPKQRLRFAQYLGKGLENRTLHSIYKRFQLLYESVKKGKFTPEEDNIVLTYLEHANVRNCYAVLAFILNRSRESVKKRHKALIIEDTKIEWTKGLFENLITYLLEAVGGSDVQVLQDSSIITNSHWKQVESKMGIPESKLKRKWNLYIYPRLFMQQFHTLDKIQTRLIDILYDSNIDDRREIRWNNLAADFSGMSGARLYKIFEDLLLAYVPISMRSNFRATVVFLKDVLSRVNNRRKKVGKFIYEEGTLIIE